ncbi:MAG: hypothetical protein ACRDIV_23935 [Ktedonobacteraceae bacterium]
MSDNTPGTREDLLRELALRLSTYPGDPRNDDPQLLVGQLPENLAIPVPMPEKSQVLGTLIRGPEQIDIVLDSELSPSAVLNFYKEHMSASGWNELDEMRHATPGGFVHSGFRAFENRTTFCKGPDGPAFIINAFERKQGQTDVRLDINVGSEYSPCAQPNRMQRRMAHHGMQNLIPPLEPPKGAKQQGGGGGGGGDSWHSNATLDTEMQLDALVPHYTAQLEKGGWIRTDEGISGPLAWSTWTFQDEDKENWNGLFFILKRPGKERQYVLEARIDWDKKEERRSGWFSYVSLV